MPGLQSAFASDQVRRSQDFIRINRLVEGSGDVWELDGGLKAIAIGPNSDLAQVRVGYYDPFETNLVHSLDVAVGSPYIGRLDALLATKYASNQPAQILAGVNDLVDNAYVPWTKQAQEKVIQVPTTVDLIGYFSDPPAVPRQRPDKRFLFSHLDSQYGVDYYIVPFYGRRYARVLVVNHDPDEHAITARVWGIRLPIGAGPGGTNRSGELQLGVIGALPAGSCGQYIVLSSVDGLWDMLMVTVDTGGYTSDYMDLRIDMSDREG